MKRLRHFTAVLVALLCAAACAGAELTVFAAASLAEALGEAAPLFTAATGHTLRFNFGGSGSLARQLQEGAPADVFLSADELRMAQLEKAGLLLANTRQVLLGNTLVLIVTKKQIPPIAGLADLQAPAIRRIAIGDPTTVPAGIYARICLEKSGHWTSLAKKLVPVGSVRAALTAVETGNADAGFVYKTDALTSSQARIALEFPLIAGSRIAYPAAVIKNTASPDSARALIRWLAAEEAQAIFVKHGFLPGSATSPPPDAPPRALPDP